MVRWFRLSDNQYLGFFMLGLVFFILQELPYTIMPFIPLESNPLMKMQDESAVLNMIEKLLGISCIVVMLFLVRGDAEWFSKYLSESAKLPVERLIPNKRCVLATYERLHKLYVIMVLLKI